MTELQRMKLIQEEYEARKHTVTNVMGVNQHAKEVGGENLHQPKENKTPKVRAEIAEEHKIPEGAVKAAVEVGRGIDRAAEVDPAIKTELLSKT